ncbi:MAG: hypothetical protein WA116_08550, partial [Anaerolineaceae bacterium]
FSIWLFLSNSLALIVMVHFIIPNINLGHFYFAHLGHYHFALTPRIKFPSPRACYNIMVMVSFHPAGKEEA